jgi:hypothetical protein
LPAVGYLVSDHCWIRRPSEGVAFVAAAVVVVELGINADAEVVTVDAGGWWVSWKGVKSWNFDEA